MSNFRLDLPSFWIGMLSASLLWLAFQRISPFLPKFVEKLKSRFEKLGQRVSASIENKYRQEVIAIMQENHLVSPLFSLDEIAIPPKLIAPLRPIYVDGSPTSDNLSAIAIPFLPKWPEVSIAYSSETIEIPDALTAGQDIAIIGKPGIGKTFALSYLAARVAQKHPFAKQLANLVPIFVHVGDLPTEKSNLVEVLYEGVHEKMSSVVESQLQVFFEKVLQTGNALILLDGMDELPLSQQKPIIEFINKFKKAFPLNRIITTGDTNNLSWTEQLDFSQVSLASWDEHEINTFINEWQYLWATHVLNENLSDEDKANSGAIFFAQWVAREKKSSTPFTRTLKLWALYAGDVSGNSEYDAIEAYISRMTPSIKNSKLALEKLAMQAISTQSPLLSRTEAGKFVADFEGNDGSENTKPFIFDESSDDLNDLFSDIESLKNETSDPIELVSVEGKKGKEKKIKARQVRRILPELVESGILVYRENKRISFRHMLISGYLAGNGLMKVVGGKALLHQPDWVGKSLAISTLASLNQIDDLIQPLLNQSAKDPLKRSLVEMASWLGNAPVSARWRKHVIKIIARDLNSDALPIGLRANIVAALALSRENGILALFLQMINANNYGAKMLGTLGCGLMKQESAIEPLGAMIYENSPALGYLACMALVAINTQKSLEIVTTAILNASEEVRRAAAEALSQHEKEGHAVLKDATKVEDLLVRRASVFGLGKVNQPWADMLLSKIQIEDSQWVVRSAAAQVLEDKESQQSSVPRPFTPIHELPWLITYAGEQGMGISPGQSGWDMVQKSLANGDEIYKLAALEIYRRFPSEGKVAFPELYKLLHQSDDWEIKEAVYNTLWVMNASGIELPPANQFAETA